MPPIVLFDHLPDSMTEAGFWGTFGDREHQHLDFKRGATDLTEIVPAMSMADGGLVVLGISDARELAHAGWPPAPSCRQ